MRRRVKMKTVSLVLPGYSIEENHIYERALLTNHKPTAYNPSAGTLPKRRDGDNVVPRCGVVKDTGCEESQWVGPNLLQCVTCHQMISF
jgi:hypothetical protein